MIWNNRKSYILHNTATCRTKTGMNLNLGLLNEVDYCYLQKRILSSKGIILLNLGFCTTIIFIAANIQ
jgi:hypothetical protein